MEKELDYKLKKEYWAHTDVIKPYRFCNGATRALQYSGEALDDHDQLTIKDI